MEEFEKLLKVEPDCTEITQLSAQSIRNAIAAKELEAVWFGRACRVPARALKEWIAKRTGPRAA